MANIELEKANVVLLSMNDNNALKRFGISKPSQQGLICYLGQTFVRDGRFPLLKPLEFPLGF